MNAHEATKAVITRRPDYLVASTRKLLADSRIRTRMFVALCGCFMSATEAEFILTLAEERLASILPERQKPE